MLKKNPKNLYIMYSKLIYDLQRGKGRLKIVKHRSIDNKPTDLKLKILYLETRDSRNPIDKTKS